MKNSFNLQHQFMVRFKSIRSLTIGCWYSNLGKVCSLWLDTQTITYCIWKHVSTRIIQILRRNDDKVSLPSRRLSKWGTNMLRYQGAIIHNSLVDLNLHNTTSKLVVKNKLKSIYLSSYVWKGSFCLHCQNSNLLYFLSKFISK